MEFPWKKLRKRSIDGIDDLSLAIVQDSETNEILMVAFTNEEALNRTLNTGEMHYYSTTKRRIWRKGESSGNVQKVDEIYIDCDGDAVLFRVRQRGGACHNGYKSCFYRKFDMNKGDFIIVGRRVFNPERIYKNKNKKL
ncbi:MAG: phosphoribosyl-AMP cyclohydrolase [Candidatus Altiarchaeales archaeon]|nr:MAG: phosphoribosyl-AMP cyclohydrolase [Candidatus Altiarchaeales archaeon]